MAGEVDEVGRVDEWVPVCRGFRVSLSDGERGLVEGIRLGEDAVELAVVTGLFVRRVIALRANEIEAILPGARWIVVRGANGTVAADAAGELEVAGGIVRMPVRHSSRIGAPQKAA